MDVCNRYKIVIDLWLVVAEKKGKVTDTQRERENRENIFKTD